MKIIIPMSGQGKRFKEAGYTVPKPLILVDGKPIIEYVVAMFPKETDIIFICNREHLETTSMRQTLLSTAPQAKIVPIDSHSLGPVHAVAQVFEHISDDEEVWVSYCDYFMNWDYAQVMDTIRKHGYEGAVPAYTGFHPHLLHKGLYGGILVDKENLMKAYKEKHSFTENLMDSHHSAGAYYFKKGSDLKRYLKEIIDDPLERIHGEAYMSMPYYLFLRDKKKVFVPEVKHFMQWGTPEDFEEFEGWVHELGISRGKTSVPKTRLEVLRVPHEKGSEAYEKCYTYWKSYFQK